MGEGAERDSGQASGRSMRLRSRVQCVLVGTPDLLGDGRLVLGSN